MLPPPEVRSIGDQLLAAVQTALRGFRHRMHQAGGDVRPADRPACAIVRAAGDAAPPGPGPNSTGGATVGTPAGYQALVRARTALMTPASGPDDPR